MKTLPLIAASAGLLWASASGYAAADDLFTEVRPQSVFQNSQPAAPSTNSASPGQRIRTSQQLAELIRQAGLSVKETDQQSVSTSKDLDQWQFPIEVRISDDERHLEISVGLSVIDDQQLPAEKLLALLEASRRYAPAQFTYSAARKRTELYLQIANADLSSDGFRDQMNRLTIMARDTSNLWYLADSDTTASAESTDTASNPVSAPSSEPDPQPGLNAAALTGRWAAVRSPTEAFAIQFAADGRFVLVYVANGQQTRSTGTFQLSDQQLTLSAGDGFRLAGSVTVKTATEFRFVPRQTATSVGELTFTKAE